MSVSKYVDPTPCEEGYLQAYSTVENSATCKKIERKNAETEPTSCRADGTQVGGPIMPATGDKIRNETDYTDGGAAPLSFERFYSSIWGMSDRPVAGMGSAWGHNHQVRLDDVGAKKVVTTGVGGRREFVKDLATQTWSAPGSADTLTSGGSGWIYRRSEDDATLNFDSSGKLLTLVARNGWTTSYGYNGLQVTSVTNAFGRALGLAYNGAGQLTSVTTPDGRQLQYAYDVQGRLQIITYPDGRTRKFTFINTTWPNALNGIIDEDGYPYATFKYRAEDGKAWSTELAQGVQKYTVDYPSNGVAAVADPIGLTRFYTYGTKSGKLAISSSSAPSPTGEADAASRVQDANGLVTSETDFKGVVTTTTWDNARRLPLTVTRAAGTPEAVSVTPQWHPIFRLPSSVIEAGRTTNYTYDLWGNLLSKAIVDATGSGGGMTRTWSYTYDVRNLPVTEAAPNGAVSNFEYDVSGNLTKSTNAMGHVTSYGYDAANRLTSLTAPNGVVNSYVYDARDRITSQTVGGQQTTSMTYNKTGTLASVLLPSGLSVAYQYDHAHRLTGWTNNRGESGTFTLDSYSNRTAEQIKNSDGSVAWATARSYMYLNRLQTIQTAVGSNNDRWNYLYDANGEVIKETDALLQDTQYGRDALRRVKSVTNAINATATLGRNALGDVTQATDFNGVVTAYGRDPIGNATSEASNDIGSRATQYDGLGLPSQVTDALGQAIQIQRDAIGRPTFLTLSDGKTTTLRYDHDSIGYLSEIVDRSGRTEYTRDSFGRVTLKKQTLANGSEQAVSYSYNPNGTLASIGYPKGGGLLTYAYDATGRLTTLLLNGSPLVTNITWNAMGMPTAWTWALTTPTIASRTYNPAGRLTATEFSGYGYDPAGRVNSISQYLYAPTDDDPKSNGFVGAVNSIWLTYTNSANRITQLTYLGMDNNATFGYDPNGNRLTSYRGLNGATTSRTYTVTPASNQVQGFEQAMSGLGYTSVNYGYNANGDLLSDGLRTYTYDAEGRLATATTGATDASPTTRYAHNALGQRVFKTEPLFPPEEGDASNPSVMQSLVTFFTKLWNPASSQAEQLGYAYVYDEQGTLIAEEGSGGGASAGRAQYFYLPTANGPMPIVAVIDGSTFAVQSDHLNTPRQLTNASGQVAWQWPYSAYGETKPRQGWTRFADLDANPNPGNTEIREVRFNLRYPGQYADEESGLFYNYFRSYCPTCGRYTQPDPSGLKGGWNRIIYANDNPFSYFDPRGLDLWGNDPSLKRIPLSDRAVRQWIDRSAQESPPLSRESYLIEARRLGLDVYDSNLVAAERYAETFVGNYGPTPVDRGLLLGMNGLKNTRSLELEWALGKNGSRYQDSGYATGWGFKGSQDRNAGAPYGGARSGCE